MPEIKVFSEETISIQEVETYYNLDGIPVPEDRPYTWTMSVSTLDGYIGFKDPDSEGPSEIALAHIPKSGSGADYRLLNAGWMYADAVLGSGSILRSEPNIVWLPVFDDLVEHRVKVFKKPKYPLNVILTGSGDVDLSHHIFHHPDLHTLIFTTPLGNEKITPQLHKLPTPSLTKIEVVRTENESASAKNKYNFDGADFKTIAKLLRTKYDVKYLDVTAGGIVIGTMVHNKLVDEMRVTVASQVCGIGAELRPSLFVSPPGVVFTHHNNPILKYKKIGIFGEHHIFIRSTVQYRH